MIGTAAQRGMFFSRAYRKPAALNAIQPVTRAARNAPSVWIIGIILASAIVGLIDAEEPTAADLVRRVAQAESETEAARNQYAYRQSFTIQELSEHGAAVGEYRDTRDVIFSPTQERTEKAAGSPLSTLKNLKLTDEDFEDIRNIQPLMLVRESLPIYETRYRGEEKMDDLECYVLQVRPRQILSGQRLFDGMIWIKKDDYAIVRTEGQAVPQIHSMKQENLFPHFTTIRKPIDGKHWFPVYTYADDTLGFRNGPQRIRLMIRYSNYMRFGSESSITFGK